MRFILVGYLIAGLSLIGSIASAQETPSDLFREQLQLAEQGDARAQFVVGFSLDVGEGVAENDVEAVKWYRKAAEQGYVEAQYNLGVMYGNGDGVPENDVEAVKWYRKAAEQGAAMAQNNIGVMYANGEGVPENDVKAYSWYSLSAAQGNQIAKDNKPKLVKYMTREQIAEAQSLAAKCFEADYKGCD